MDAFFAVVMTLGIVAWLYGYVQYRKPPRQRRKRRCRLR